jgi:AhpC/TSA family
VKKIVDSILVIIAGIAVYTLGSYSNVLHYFSIANAVYMILYFISGLIINAYYNHKLTVTLFISVTFLLLASVVFVKRGIDTQLMIYSASIFSSFVLGYSWKKWSNPKRMGLAFCLAIFYFLSIFYIYPAKTYKTISTARNDLINENFQNFFNNISLKNTSGHEGNSLFTKDNVYLIEFYFKNCTPCRLKEKALTQLRNEISDSSFKIIYIEDGKIDNYDTYLLACKELGSNGNRYYDVDGNLSENLKVEGYPFEVVIDKKGKIRNTLSGYGHDITDYYLRSQKNIIEKLLNEN